MSDGVVAPVWHATASSVFGSVCNVYAGLPFDTVKVRAQTGGQGGHVGRLLLHQLRSEGFFSLYRGAVPALASTLAEGSVLFTANAALKRGWLALREQSSGEAVDDNQPFELWELAVIGGAAGFFSGTAICPFELVKVRLQTADSGFTGPVHCAVTTVRQEGARALFRGLPTLWARDIPFNTAFLGSYEAITYLMTGSTAQAAKDDLSLGQLLLAGGLAGVCGWTVMMPMDVVKSRMQASRRPLRMGDVLRDVYAENGVRGLYRGWTAAVCRAFPANAGLLAGYELGLRLLAKLTDDGVL
eukprot:PLAT1413.3.p1 GENE.PLAT1413.3~~PLAT1413.3.p1  ORF type:complete len:300 (+),score=90.56 PLAT1413.3:29-928(+)